MLYDSDYLYAFHLQGKDATVTIAKVAAGELTGEGGRKAKKPIVWFEGKEKPLALNKTNGKIVATMYGTDTTKWIGQAITLYPTTTNFGGETKDCIRVRPKRPE
jgi:hypothetical protein